MASRPEDNLLCPICHAVFTHPVILSCSHSFCRACWQRWWTLRSNRRCPVCNATSQQYDPPCNLALKNLCEASPPEKHSAVFCSLHSEELKLFCEDHQTPVCVICLHSSSHNNHSFRPINEVALGYREGLRILLEPLKETLDLFKDMKSNLDQSNKDIEDQAKDAETQINKEFSMLQELLKKEQKARTGAVMKEKKQKSLVLKWKMEDLSRDIEALSDKVRATEEVLKAGNISFLQNYTTAADGVDGFQLKDPQPIKDGLIDTFKHLDNLPLQVLDSMKKAITRSRSGPPLAVAILPQMDIDIETRL
nr:PREDICTED: tripartite motif-containing protein 35-like [Notothenia coriiceps]